MKEAPEYWQAVIRFGLPFGVVVLGIDYTVFRITNHGLRYSWGSHIVEDVLMTFVASTAWWLLRSRRKTK
jgi:hypothetical protein